ncbi:MAG: peptidoglycan DD-metalloendopeptidase family protein [Bacteroidota bacterium]
MKPKKIKITPKNLPPSDKQMEDRSATGNRTNRETGRSKLIIRTKNDGYQQLKEENENISESYQKFRRNALIIGAVLLLGLVAISVAWMWGPDNDPLIDNTDTSTYRYGFDLAPYQIHKDIVEDGQGMTDILMAYNVPTTKIPEIQQLAEPVMDIQSLQGRSMVTVLTSETNNQTEYIIYEPNKFEYTVFDLRDTLRVYRIEREVDIRLSTASAIIDSALWKTILDENLHYDLIGKMEEALQWSVDFYHLEPGDRFKLVYESVYADGEAADIRELKAIYFQTKSGAHEAYYYTNGQTRGFFDEKARPMKRGFLQSPVKYARISSPFNLKRKHPVLQKVKPHLGTDYAAPEGTPILAVADGVVSIATFKKNNGNYVKIRHDKTYETQYLHMSKFAPGIKRGVKVKQGEVIGLVGSTGLASGPHVCFRFWKNGQQVDHRAEKLPAPNPLPDQLASQFLGMKDSLELKLASIGYN